MKNLKQLMMVTLLMGGFALLSGCADTNPTDPFEEISLTAAFGKGDKGGPPKDGGDGGTPTNLSNVQWIAPLAEDITASGVCKWDSGCTISIPEVGLDLIVPEETLSTTTTITVTAVAGTDVNFVFGPHGTQFGGPVTVKVAQENTNVVGKVDVWVNYWETDPSNVIETFQAKIFKNRILFSTDHFSGYALAM